MPCSQGRHDKKNYSVSEGAKNECVEENLEEEFSSVAHEFGDESEKGMTEIKQKRATTEATTGAATEESEQRAPSFSSADTATSRISSLIFSPSSFPPPIRQPASGFVFENHLPSTTKSPH